MSAKPVTTLEAGRYMKQCPNCRGAGFLKATLMMSANALRNIDKLAEILPDEPVPVAKEKCRQCDGEGRIYAG